MQVENILQSKGHTVQTVPIDAAVSDAVATLNTHRIGAVVVVDAKGRGAGILSERRLSGDPIKLLSSPVSAVMTPKVITTDGRASVSDLMELMTRHRIRHLPVVDDGELVGIVSIGDVVKRKIEEAEHETNALREYIAS